ncbi:MAG: threonylcarbamoyl-AMP synthase [Clostridiales bacterium]|nr:threonylcarbamoyl-AMP synthase [Clostridiales bacterium]
MIDTKLLKINDKSLEIARNYILDGEVVAFPTETVYGLGGIAFKDQTVKKIFEAKGRPQDNPLIVHVHKDYDVDKLVEVEHDYVYKLREAFSSGPLTMVYKSRGVISPVATCGLGTVGIRIPSHSGASEFLKAVDVPIAAPSANASKHTSPVTAMHVYEDLKGKIPLILDGGKCDGGIESTVLDVTTDTPIILRSGLVTAEMIKKVVGKCEYSNNKPTDKVRAPGMKYQHYTPKCQTALFRRKEIEKAQKLYDESVKNGLRVYFMCDDGIASFLSGNKLKLGKNATEIAFNLYDMLHEAEKVCDLLIAFDVDTGSDVDVGIMNRLTKACLRF